MSAPTTPISNARLPLRGASPPIGRATRAKLQQAQSQSNETSLIRELYTKGPNDIWVPSFSVAFRLLILIRVCGAMYSSVTTDCDEVYNYWEPLHFLLEGDGLRTWEYSSKYAIRSWAYLLVHAVPARLVQFVNPTDKRVPFFAVRLSLALLCTLSEVTFYRSIAKHVGARAARYTLLFLLMSAGMYNAGTALLPSSFSMYFIMLGWSFALEPVNSSRTRTVNAVICFAASAIVGWPFSIVLAVPFVLEEILLRGRQTTLSIADRIARLVAGAVPALGILAAVVGIDSFFYGRLVVAPWNIVSYNVLSNTGGPDLFGTEPWYYYLFNGILNLNILYPLALLSLPALAITALVEPKRLAITQPEQTSSAILLAVRLSPFYLWFGLLTAQAHKEERFMFPAFPLICFQAAVTLSLARGWMQHFYVKTTKASFQAARTPIFSINTTLIVLLSTLLSMARILAVQQYFRAPMTALFHLQYADLPALAIQRYPERYPKLTLENYLEAKEQLDLSPLAPLNLTLCYGGEWYRYPSSFLLPNEVRVDFVMSSFTAQSPRHFVERRQDVGSVRKSLRAKQAIAAASPPGFNDRNVRELGNFVPLDSCSYVVETIFPHRKQTSIDGFNEAAWERVKCWPFLDLEESSRLTRSFYLPFLDERNKYADFCLLRNPQLASSPF